MGFDDHDDRPGRGAVVATTIDRLTGRFTFAATPSVGDRPGMPARLELCAGPPVPSAADRYRGARDVLREYGVTRGTEQMNRDMRRAADTARVAGDATAVFAEEFWGKPLRGMALAVDEQLRGAEALITALREDPFGTVIETSKGVFIAVCTVDLWAVRAVEETARTMAGNDNVAKGRLVANLYFLVVTWPEAPAAGVAGGVAHLPYLPGGLGKLLAEGRALSLAEIKAALRAEGLAAELAGGTLRLRRAADLPDRVLDELARQVRDRVERGTLAGVRPQNAAPGVIQRFRSFSALKRALGSAGEGNVWHHIVEQTPGNVARFGPEAIHNTQNVVRLSAAINQRIANYYSSIRPFTGGRTVRAWLAGQSLEAQEAFGRRLLQIMLSGGTLP